MARDLDVVRHELSNRMAVFDRRTTLARPAELAAAMNEIRVIATGAGLNAAVTVARFIAAALANGERGAGVQAWIGVLGDAIGCERHDGAACDAFAAACSIRLAD